MNKPLTINLQINVYPDGTVQVNGTPQSSHVVATASTLEAHSTPSSVTSSATPEQSTPGPSSNSTASGAPSGPSETDVRTALLAAVKASDKATAVGVLETIAGVNRVPDVPADKRQEVIAALDAIVAAKSA